MKRKDLLDAEEKVSELGNTFRKSASLSDLAGIDDVLKVRVLARDYWVLVNQSQ